MRSLKTQLSLAFALLVLVTVAIISFLSNTLIERRFEAYVTKLQTERIAHIADDLSLQYNQSSQAWNMNAVHTVGMAALQEGYIAKVFNSSGDLLWDAENHDMAECRHIMEDISNRMSAYGASGDFVSHSFALTQNAKPIGSVHISYYGSYFLSENDFNFIRSLNILLTIVGLVSLLLSIVMGVVLAQRIARPIAKTAEIATRITAGKYDMQFEGKTKTIELHNLVLSINHLASALSKQENLRKHLTADVAHELRTPLATLGTHLEAMIEGVWEPTPERLKSCHEEIMRLSKMVADLEHLERAESDNLHLNKSPTDLLALAHSVSDNFAGELKIKNQQLIVVGEAVVVNIDKDRISGVIGNLISNAVKYTPEGGHIQITVRQDDENAVFAIADNGIGIPEEELPFIFERFYRADKSRNRGTGGAGIGLAIVKSVVTAHGGTVQVESKVGEGSRFQFTIHNA